MSKFYLEIVKSLKNLFTALQYELIDIGRWFVNIRK